MPTETASSGPVNGAKFKFEDVATWRKKKLLRPPQLIKGMLYQGGRIAFGGASKGKKSWVMLDAITAISTGTPFMGHETTKAAVAYVNMELPEAPIQDRINEVLEAKKMDVDPGLFSILNLRNTHTNFDTLLMDMVASVPKGRYGLIVFDPLYKLLGERDENSASDIGNLMHAFEIFTAHTGASVAYVDHYAKGDQTKKFTLDRLAGSGVKSRDADLIIGINEGSREPGTFVMDFTVRCFKEIPNVGLRWEHPLMRPDFTVDPNKIRSPGTKPCKYTLSMLLDCLETTPMTHSDFAAACHSAHGMSKPTFSRLLREASEFELVAKIDNKWVRGTPSNGDLFATPTTD